MCRCLATGEEVSLETENDLLALVAYYGLGNWWTTEESSQTVLEHQMDNSWWPLEQEGGPGEQSEDNDGVDAHKELLSEVSVFSEMSCWLVSVPHRLGSREAPEYGGVSLLIRLGSKFNLHDCSHQDGQCR